MIKPICRNLQILAQKARPATKQDIPLAKDLLETLAANSADCVGMAANMIGASKAIIAIRDEKRFLLLYNPVITMHSLTYYDTEEGCLSLAGKRPCRRYDWVEVKYEDEDFHKKRKRFQGFTAEIIQHEMDHLEGILI